VRKTKKWAALTVAASIMLTTAACGSNSNNGGDNNAAASNSPSTAANESQNTGGPKPELRALFRAGGDYNTDPIALMLQEKTGYTVKYDSLPTDKPEDKLNLLMASAEPYDIVTTNGDGGFKALYADYAKKGALVDLTPLIEKYGQNIKASVSQESLDAVKVDGKIYAIPTRTIEYVGVSLMIRKDWLDKLNLQVPTTLDELTHVLQEFKEKDPGGNGSNNTPMSIKGDTPMVDNIAGAFGIANEWNAVDGKLVPRAIDPAFKDYLTYMTDLYKQGLLDKEFAINKDATMKEKFTSGRAGVIPLHWADIPAIDDALKKNFPDAQYVYVPALKGKDGKAGLAQMDGFDRLTFIPKASKHPEDAIKWIDAKLEPETFKDLAIGVEGVHHTVQDGNYYPILPAFNDERSSGSNFVSGVDETNYPIYWQARVRKDDRLYAGFDFLNNQQPKEVDMPNLLGLAPYLPQYSADNAQLTQMANDYTVKVIVGGESLDKFDDYVAKFQKNGGEDSYNEVNEWYATVQK
jgi:ABC-type sugar transport system, periplasmic component